MATQKGKSKAKLAAKPKAVVKHRVASPSPQKAKAKPATRKPAHPPAKPKAAAKPARPQAPAAKGKTPKSAPQKSGKPSIEKKILPVPKPPLPQAKSPEKPVKTVQKVVRTPEVIPSPDSTKASGVGIKFLVSVAQAIKDAVYPFAKSVRGREIVDEATSGDVTFQIDRVAEKALQMHLRAANLPLSYYSEDEGYSTFTSKQPKHLLIVDPIDGTRAAKSGFEGCVVSVASTRVLERPTMADIDCACVMEIMGDRIFLAERGKGARYYADGHLKRPKLSQNTELEAMSWSMTIPARPAELIFPTAARIIDLSSLKGGFFSCNSTSYSLTRLLTNQLDACVDVANRYYRDIPERVEDYFINAGRGKIIGIAPYDMAAALLIAQEAGCRVTDAYGNGFDDLLLLDSSKGNHRSIIAASNAALHEKMLNFFDTRIKQYEALLTRHMPQKV